MTFKKYPIIEDEGRDRIWWNDIHSSQPGTVFGLAGDIQTVTDKEYNRGVEESKQKSEGEAMEKEKIQPSTKPDGTPKTEKTERQKPAAKKDNGQKYQQKL